MSFRIWQIIPLTPSVKGTCRLLVDPGHVSLGERNVTLRRELPQPLQTRGQGESRQELGPGAQGK
jgi:hypothetical protein